MIPLPDDDRTLSPFTGWTRDHLTRVADTIIAGAARHASPAQSLIGYPGPAGPLGRDVDHLEGFTRTFMLAAFRIAGDPAATGDIAERYGRGIAAGVDPEHPERWVRPDEHPQAKVEAAALALGLHLTRNIVWAQLAERTQQQVIEYLATFIGGSYPPNNWAWFRIIVEQFLESVDGPFSLTDREQDFALLDSFELGGGWTSDGAGRSFDHYSGWALPFYPIIWAEMVGDAPEHAARIARYRSRLDDYLDDALHLIGADGGPLIQGRSLTYRFATAAPVWAAAYHGQSRHDPGLLRRAASGQVKHFVERGAPDADGILSLGWHGRWDAIAQNYSGPGSPYWAAKGMLGLALPADHQAWTAVEQPLPINGGDFARVLVTPGWLAVGTAEDGVVRVVNHGTDHRLAGSVEPDAPLYAKFGYSTATSPVMTGDGVGAPLDGTVALLREDLPSHRSGFTVGAVDTLRPSSALGADTLIGASTARAHWPIGFTPESDHGVSHHEGRTDLGPLIDVVSVVRGSWEVRFVRVRDGADGTAALHPGDLLRVGGWALTAPDVQARTGAPDAVPAEAAAAGAGMVSSVVALRADVTAAGVLELTDATPLDGRTAVPWIAARPVADEWLVFGILLGGPSAAAAAPELTGDREITWSDGQITTLSTEALRA